MKEIKAFRLIALLEGLSLILLIFLAVPLKYMFGLEQAVGILGPVHGGLFVLYCILGIYLTMDRDWGFVYGIKIFLASLFPFGTIILDKSLRIKMEEAARS